MKSRVGRKKYFSSRRKVKEYKSKSLKEVKRIRKLVIEKI